MYLPNGLNVHGLISPAFMAYSCEPSGQPPGPGCESSFRSQTGEASCWHWPGDLGNQHSDCILKFLEAVYRLARPAVGNGLLAATLTKEATARLTSSEILGRNQALFALLSCQWWALLVPCVKPVPYLCGDKSRFVILCELDHRGAEHVWHVGRCLSTQLVLVCLTAY